MLFFINMNAACSVVGERNSRSVNLYFLIRPLKSHRVRVFFISFWSTTTTTMYYVISSTIFQPIRTSVSWVPRWRYLSRISTYLFYFEIIFLEFLKLSRKSVKPFWFLKVLYYVVHKSSRIKKYSTSPVIKLRCLKSRKTCSASENR